MAEGSPIAAPRAAAAGAGRQAWQPQQQQRRRRLPSGGGIGDGESESESTAESYQSRSHQSLRSSTDTVRRTNATSAIVAKTVDDPPPFDASANDRDATATATTTTTTTTTTTAYDLLVVPNVVHQRPPGMQPGTHASGPGPAPTTTTTGPSFHGSASSSSSHHHLWPSSFDTHKTSNVGGGGGDVSALLLGTSPDGSSGGRRSIFNAAAARKYHVQPPPPSVVAVSTAAAAAAAATDVAGGGAATGGLPLPPPRGQRQQQQQQRRQRPILPPTAPPAPSQLSREMIAAAAEKRPRGLHPPYRDPSGPSSSSSSSSSRHDSGEEGGLSMNEELVPLRSNGGDDRDDNSGGNCDGSEPGRSHRSLAASEASSGASSAGIVSSGEDTVHVEHRRGGSGRSGRGKKGDGDTGGNGNGNGNRGEGGKDVAAPTTPIGSSDNRRIGGDIGGGGTYGSLGAGGDRSAAAVVGPPPAPPVLSPLTPSHGLYSPNPAAMKSTDKVKNIREVQGGVTSYQNDGGGGIEPYPSSSSSDMSGDTSSSNSKGCSGVEDDDPCAQTLHAQSFLLALAFLFVWSPQNLMAPNLTQMAEFFHFSSGQRDLYLGANIAFATGVLSLPVSALIGFLADMVPSRKVLYAGTIFMGGAAAICTGASRTYTQLYIARFVCGGMMSGSVPVAFSLLGDLFDTADRNAASSGLTAMMGTGIILGQVYAGMAGPVWGWSQPFYLSGTLSICSALLVLRYTRDPVRGGKEKVLQDMLRKGATYERKLTLGGFWHAMTRNESNLILMWQGFFSSVPWGIVFVFLNDFLSQEQGLSVPDATFLVFVFGLGCAVGGVLGGYLGQLCMAKDRSYLPLFMSATTFLGIGPFLGLLDGHFHTASILPCLYAFLAGCIASLPSVNVRPCLINVNPPEARGATLTAANLIINCARGVGPSFVTMMGGIWDVTRQFSFNITLIVFWTITAIQLVFLARSLPKDQDKMETELARYAESAVKMNGGGDVEGGMGDSTEHSLDEGESHHEPAAEDGSTVSSSLLPYRNLLHGSSLTFATDDGTAATAPTAAAAAAAAAALAAADDASAIVSIEDRMTSFDNTAVQQSVMFLRDAFREIEGLEMLRSDAGHGHHPFGDCRGHHHHHHHHHRSGSPRHHSRRHRRLFSDGGGAGGGGGGLLDGGSATAGAAAAAGGGGGGGSAGGSGGRGGERRRSQWRMQQQSPRGGALASSGAEGGGGDGGGGSRRKTWSAPDLNDGMVDGGRGGGSGNEEESDDDDEDSLVVVGRVVDTHASSDEDDDGRLHFSSLRSLEEGGGAFV